MKKNFKYILGSTIALTLLLSGCSTNSNNVDSKNPTSTPPATTQTPSPTDTNKTDVAKTTNKVFENVSFDFPESFKELKAETSPMPFIVYQIGTEGASFNLVVEELPMKLTLDQYMEAALKNFGVKPDSNKNFEINGVQWNEIVSTSAESGLKLNQRTFVEGNKAYVFTYGSFPEKYNDNLSVYEDVIKTVKLVK